MRHGHGPCHCALEHWPLPIAYLGGGTCDDGLAPLSAVESEQKRKDRKGLGKYTIIFNAFDPEKHYSFPNVQQHAQRPLCGARLYSNDSHTSQLGAQATRRAT